MNPFNMIGVVIMIFGIIGYPPEFFAEPVTRVQLTVLVGFVFLHSNFKW